MTTAETIRQIEELLACTEVQLEQLTRQGPRDWRTDYFDGKRIAYLDCLKILRGER